MIAKNLIITFLGFLVALTAYFNVQSGIKEPFLGLSGITAGAQPQRIKRNKRGQDVPTHCVLPLQNTENYTRASRSHRNRQHTHPPTFVVPGTYQSNIAPRFQPEPYSASINYNAPPQRYLGVPKHPLGHASEVGHHKARENYHANNELTASLKLDQSAPSLPSSTMDQGTGGNSITMDRFMTALNKSRSYAGADYIRGSLAVVPQAPPCLSQAMGITAQAYNPQNSMNASALEVMGGVNEQSTALNNFLQQRSGGTITTTGGVPQAVLPGTAVGSAMGVQTQMYAASRGAQNSIGATQF